jgi:hypothetical protein
MIKEAVSAGIAVGALASSCYGVYEIPDIMASEPYAEIMGHDPVSLNPADVELPPSVQRLEKALVAEDYRFMGRTVIGSGAIVEVGGRRGVLGAAHVSAFADGKCRDQQATLQTASTPLHTKIGRVIPTEIPTSEVDDFSYNHSSDATISLPKDPHVLDGFPTPLLQAHPSVHRGDVLFNIARGSSGNPEDKPKVTLALVTSVKDQQLDMLTDLRGYGDKADAGSKMGDSGGMLVDQSGHYVGDLVATGEYTYSNEQTQRQKAVWLPYKPEGYHPAYGHIVTESDARQMMQQADQANSCE